MSQSSGYRIEGHLPLIKAVARIALRKAPRQVEIGDLFHTGVIAAYAAAERYGAGLSDALLSECCRNAMRKLLSAGYRDGAAAIRETVDEAPLPDRLIEQRQRTEIFRRAMRDVSDRDREVLTELLDGKTEIEISREIDISQPAVSKRKKRAIASIRALVA